MASADCFDLGQVRHRAKPAMLSIASCSCVAVSCILLSVIEMGRGSPKRSARRFRSDTVKCHLLVGQCSLLSLGRLRGNLVGCCSERATRRIEYCFLTLLGRGAFGIPAVGFTLP